MSLKQASAKQSSPRFPRVSGDEPNWLTLLFNLTVFSPRERG